MSFADRLREQAIRREKEKLVAATTPVERRLAYERMRALVNGRSAEQVAAMEKRLGLR